MTSTQARSRRSPLGASLNMHINEKHLAHQVDLPRVAAPYSPIAEYFNGKTIFMTGATGMLGMVVCEKLVRCTGVDKIYALVRDSSGSRSAAEARLHAQWTDHLPLSASRMLLDSQRVHVMIGDVGCDRPNLGLSSRDSRKIIQEVHIFLHGAADISLVKPVSELANISIFGALRAADLANQCMQLERYTQLSSLFSQTCYSRVSENIDLWSSTEAEAEAVARGETLFDVPKTFLMNYSYTKHLAERLVVSRYPDLPTCIFRPSSIGPARSEPVHMWTYTTSMPQVNFHVMAMKLSTESSMIHSALEGQTDGSNLFDEVPVDYVVNSLLAHTAAGTQGPVNCNAGTLNPQSIGSIFAQTGHLIPKQKFASIPFSKQRGLAKVFMLFGVQPPIGSSDKTLALQQRMTPTDHQLFPIDLQNWDLCKWQKDRALMLECMKISWLRAQPSQARNLVQARL